MVIQSLEISASRYRRYVVPLLSCSIDFYVRIFVRVHESPANVKLSSTYTCINSLTNRKRGIVGRCVQCRTLSFGAFLRPCGDPKKQIFSTGPLVQDKCAMCGSRMDLAGPMWLDSLHSKSFASKVLDLVRTPAPLIDTKDRIEGLVSVISEVIVIIKSVSHLGIERSFLLLITRDG